MKRELNSFRKRLARYSALALFSLLTSSCEKIDSGASREGGRKNPSSIEMGSSGYLISAAFHKTAGAESQEKEDHFHIALHIRPADLAEVSDGTLRDPFHASFSQDQEGEQQIQAFFTKEMGAYFHLEDSSGVHHQPLTYRFIRTPGMRGVYAFVFVFAKPEGSLSVKPGQWQAVLRDFGLGTGTIRMDLQPTSNSAGKA